MRSLLVTGGAGFIGSNFVQHWVRTHEEDRLVVIDALTYAGNRKKLRAVEHLPGFRFVHGNICDGPLVEQLLRDAAIDTVVHFAAETRVDRSITGPAAFIETNVVGTHVLLEAARKVWLAERRVERHRFHHISTDEVYGSLGPHDPPFSEPRLMRLTHRIRRARPLRITWCALITTPTASKSRPATAPTTTGPITSRRS